MYALRHLVKPHPIQMHLILLKRKCKIHSSFESNYLSTLAVEMFEFSGQPDLKIRPH